MSRINFPSPENMSPEQRAVYDEVVSGPRGVVVGPLRAAIHNPILADRWQKLGSVLRYETSLPRDLNELAILVTARRWNSAVEWTIHAKEGKDAGLEEPVITAIQNGETPDFKGYDAAAEVYEYVRQVLCEGDVSDQKYKAICERWGEIGVVELTALVGYYSMVAMTLNVHQIPLPQGLSNAWPQKDGELFESPTIG